MASSTRATVLLRKSGVQFVVHSYHHDPRAPAFGAEAAAALAVDPHRIFKSLIAMVDGKPACGVVPVAGRLDVKALAGALGRKRGQLADPADAARITGYVVGGISPIAPKTRIPVVLDAGARDWATVFVSAGQRGLQLELAPADLAHVTAALVAPIAAG